jgi:hypothetical protein
MTTDWPAVKPEMVMFSNLPLGGQSRPLLGATDWQVGGACAVASDATAITKRATIERTFMVEASNNVGDKDPDCESKVCERKLSTMTVDENDRSRRRESSNEAYLKN